MAKSRFKYAVSRGALLSPHFVKLVASVVSRTRAPALLEVEEDARQLSVFCNVSAVAGMSEVEARDYMKNYILNSYKYNTCDAQADLKYYIIFLA